MSDLATLRADLAAEQRDLDALVAPLPAASWTTPTPAAGWDVADQIAHLAYFDRAATRAIADPEGFATDLEAVVAAALEGRLDEMTLAREGRQPAALLAQWRDARAGLDRAATGLAPTARVPWFGPSMGAASFLTARLMETWAHGTDVADALGIERAATARLVHVARLGYITRDWSYRVRGEEPPAESVRVELDGPDGRRWTFGDEGADDVVRGPALDFCLVVVQRRHLDDTALVTGDLGRHWLLRAQAFAGGPTTGPEPRAAR